MFDNMDAAVEESLAQHRRQSVPDYNRVIFYPHYRVRTDADGRNTTDAGEWMTYILIVSPGVRSQEIRRPATDEDQRRYADAWNAWQGKQGTMLESMSLHLQNQLDSLHRYLGKQPSSAVTPRKRGRPPKNVTTHDCH